MKHLRLALSIALLINSSVAWCCDLEPEHIPPAPTSASLLSEAQIAFTGTLLHCTEEKEKLKPAEGIYKCAVRVDRWLKGSGGQTVEVFDSHGTNCDPVFGVEHLIGSQHPVVVYATRLKDEWLVSNTRPIGFLSPPK